MTGILVETRPGQTTGHAPGGCRTCTHNLGDWIARGAHVLCRLEPDRPRVHAQPAIGCAFWQREPGAD